MSYAGLWNLETQVQVLEFFVCFVLYYIFALLRFFMYKCGIKATPFLKFAITL